MVGVRLLAEPLPPPLFNSAAVSLHGVPFAQALVPELGEVDSSLLSIEIRLFVVGSAFGLTLLPPLFNSAAVSSHGVPSISSQLRLSSIVLFF